MTKTPAAKTETLLESFTLLQKTARGPEDFLIWFKEHPAALPDLPKKLELDLDIRITGKAEPIARKGGVRYHLGFSYTASNDTANRSKTQHINAEHAAQIAEGLGVIGYTENSKTLTFHEGSLSIFLELKNCPFAAAAAAFKLLASSEPQKPWVISAPGKDAVRKAWNKNFKAMPFDVLEKLHGTGLSPSDSNGFIAWALDSQRNKPSVASAATVPDIEFFG